MNDYEQTRAAVQAKANVIVAQTTAAEACWRRATEVTQSQHLTGYINTPPEIKALDPIEIDSKHFDKLLKEMPFSAPLKNILRHLEYRSLRDLHGVSYTDLAQMCSLERHHLMELHEAVRPFERPPPSWAALLNKISTRKTSQACFHIPPPGRKLKLLGLPISNRHLRVLTDSGFTQLGDLDGMFINELMIKRHCGQQMLTCLEDVIQHVSSYPDDFKVSIPTNYHRRSIEELPASPQLIEMLTSLRFQKLGDLQGLSIKELANAPQCSDKALTEFLHHMQRLRLKDVSFRTLEPTLSIQPAGQKLKLQELPLSTRLLGILTNAGFTRLGDLDGLTEREILQQRNSARKSLAELKRIIHLANNDELAAGKVEFHPSDTHQLLSRLDDLMAQLPTQDQNILHFHFGHPLGQQHSLKETGAEFSLTHQQIRNIISTRMVKVLKLGGPALYAKIRGLKSHCATQATAINGPQLAQWFNSDDLGLFYGSEIYARLLNQLLQLV